MTTPPTLRATLMALAAAAMAGCATSAPEPAPLVGTGAEVGEVAGGEVAGGEAAGGEAAGVAGAAGSTAAGGAAAGAAYPGAGAAAARSAPTPEAESHPVGTPVLHSAIADFAARLAEEVAADSVGSLVAAVVADGDVAWEGAFGLADRADSVPATTETVYRVGSISKTVTALLLLRLVEEGVVALDDPVRRWVPEVERLAGRRATDAPITLRHLASHTSGLAREPASSVAARGRMARWDRKVVESIPLTEAMDTPGERYRYSNIGFGILGLALERAADRPFENLVEEHILEPLGMTSSYFRVPRGDRDRLAAGYVNLRDGTIDPRVPRAEHHGRGYKVPNGGLYSTLGDLTRLAMALAGHPDYPLLGDAARTALLDDHTPDADDRAGYGLGVHLIDLGGTVLVGHGGTVAGYNAYLATDPATTSAVVLLRNYNRGRTNLAAEAQRLLLALREPPQE